MKKYLYLLLMPLLVIASCEKPEIEPEQDPVVGKITLKSDAAIVLSDEGSSEQVEFTATLDWKAVSDQEWLTVTPKAGLAGDASVTMSAEKNTLEESRNAIVTLTCGEDTKTIEVTQKQAGALLLTQSSIEVAAEGGTVTITAKSNSNATASVDASAMTWITEVKTKALVEYVFNFVIAANESEMPRTGKIVFSNADGKREVVTIVQEGMYVEPDVTDLVAECVAITSSTLVFKWEENLETSELVKHAFTATLYKDAACTEAEQSFDFPAGCEAWNNKTPKYVFGGLQPSTDYWFKVFDTTADLESEPIKCTTDPFTHVLMPSTITSTGVVLAEDFGEIRWDYDHITAAAGFIPSDKSDFVKTAVDEYSSSDDNEMEFKSCGDAIKKSRLNGWLSDTYASVHPGCIKLGTTESKGWMLSPEFTVPEGKKAVVKVTVTAARFDTNQVEDWVLTVVSPDRAGAGKEGEHTAFFDWPDTADKTLYQKVKFSSTDWETKTVEGLVLQSRDRIAFGSFKEAGKTAGRGYLSDMVVEVLEIIDDASGETPEIEGLVAECLTTTSSTLAFKWEEDLEASELVSHAFTATLYKDASCTVVDQSFNFPAGCAAWNNNIPKYVFGGLQSATDYWFKVFDTTANIESEPIKCTTDPFTHVLMPQTITSTGVVLAEDFGEIRWGFDHMTNAVGFSPSDKSDFANTAVEGFNYSGSKEFEFKSFGDAIKKSRLNGWLTDTYGFVHPGYIKLGTENAGGWILTPAFTVPEGKKAVVKITVTAARFDTNQTDDWMLAVIPEKDAGAGNDGEHTAYFNWPDTYDNTLYQHIIFDNTDWATKSVQGIVVNAGDRIAFGSAMALKNNVRRGYISDMIVEVLEIVDIDDINRTTKVSILGDSISTFKGWSDSSKGSAYYPRTDCDVTYVNQTWWHRLIYNYMSTGVFEKNISAGNTTIVQNTTGDKSKYWYGWDFGTRVQKLGLGDPDVIMVFGGTNDYGHTLYNSTTEELIDGVAMGAETFPATSNARLEELLAAADAATTVAAADALDGTTYAGACIRLIQMLRVRHPKAKIVFIIGDYVYYGMGEVARKIVDHFSDDYVRKVDILGEYGYKASSAIKKFDYAHPTGAGMDVIASYVYEQVGEWIDENN